VLLVAWNNDNNAVQAPSWFILVCHMYQLSKQNMVWSSHHINPNELMTIPQYPTFDHDTHGDMVVSFFLCLWLVWLFDMFFVICRLVVICIMLFVGLVQLGLFHVNSCQFMSIHVILCHFMSFHVISCHFMSFHVRQKEQLHDGAWRHKRNITKNRQHIVTKTIKHIQKHTLQCISKDCVMCQSHR
jgi:hypothetical protein